MSHWRIFAYWYFVEKEVGTVENPGKIRHLGNASFEIVYPAHAETALVCWEQGKCSDCPKPLFYADSVEWNQSFLHPSPSSTGPHRLTTLLQKGALGGTQGAGVSKYVCLHRYVCSMQHIY